MVSERSGDISIQDAQAGTPSSSIFERASAGDIQISNVTQVIARLATADPSKVQEIAASQIELLIRYYDIVLVQARQSFLWALIAAGVGLGFFLAAVTFLLWQQSQQVAVISLISGARIEVISGINFYLYGKAADRMSDFQNRLNTTQRFLLANSVCEGLEGEAKQQARAALVRTIAMIEERPTPSASMNPPAGKPST